MKPAAQPQQKSYRKGSTLRFSAGLVLSLVLVVTAFEWKTPYVLLQNGPIAEIPLIDEPMKVVSIPHPQPPAPPKPKGEIVAVPDPVPTERIEIIEPPIIKDPLEPGISVPPLIATPPVDDIPDEPLDFVEEEAIPIGGMKEFYAFLSKNIEYPRQAQRSDIEGKVYVRFVIDEKGNVVSAEVLEGRGLGHGLDEEAIRVIKMTKWSPAKQRGRAVKQRKVIPVKFELQP